MSKNNPSETKGGFYNKRLTIRQNKRKKKAKPLCFYADVINAGMLKSAVGIGEKRSSSVYD